MLRHEQQRRLAAADPDIAPRFVDGIDALPDGPLLLVANEFLDALPIRQLVRGRNGWAERLVALEHRGGAPGLRRGTGKPCPRRCWCRPACATRRPARSSRYARPPPPWPPRSASGSRAGPGAALFIDYGYFPSRPGPTLAALRRHAAAVDPRRAGRGGSQRPCRFRRFRRGRGGVRRRRRTARCRRANSSLALGAEARLATLSRRAAPAQRAALESGLARLIDPARDGQFVQGAGLDLAGAAGARRVCRHQAASPRDRDNDPPC